MPYLPRYILYIRVHKTIPPQCSTQQNSSFSRQLRYFWSRFFETFYPSYNGAKHLLKPNSNVHSRPISRKISNIISHLSLFLKNKCEIIKELNSLSTSFPESRVSNLFVVTFRLTSQLHEIYSLQKLWCKVQLIRLRIMFNQFYTVSIFPFFLCTFDFYWTKITYMHVCVNFKST